MTVVETLDRLRALGFDERAAKVLADHFLDADRRGKAAHGTARIDWLTHQGSTTADAVGTRQGTEVRSYSVLKARQLFSLTYAGPPGSAKSALVNALVASF